MKPKDILIEQMNKTITPFLTAHKFTFSESKLEYKRKIDNIIQSISFSLNKWNNEDNCDFWTMWGVTSKEYEKWFQLQWNSKPTNNSLGGKSDWNIMGWTKDHFQLTNNANDSVEVNELLMNIEMAGFPFLEKISTWTGAAEEMLKDGLFYCKPSDFYILEGKYEDSLKTLKAGLEKFKNNGSNDQFNELPGIIDRLNKFH